MLIVKNSCFIGLKIALCSLALLFFFNSQSKEGMWIPATLKAHENELKAMGLDLPVDQLYNASGTGLNNAIVLFGRGCTGEIISSNGLILTNHHCGYGTVQGLSSTEKDYFANGFFAKDFKDEIPCGGLTVTFIRRMENVTDKIVPGLADTLQDAARDSIIKARIAGLEKEFEMNTGMDATVKPFYEGNQYWVIISETYKDIRLVGFPPNGIGTFGGDDENWAWPRHTGDFSMFRVYAGADNKPAAYAAGNKPYHATTFLPINTSGYKEGDFTMVYGFPGTTMEYISSFELNQVYNIVDPINIDARTKKLKIWSKHMNANREVFLKYTAKRAGVANGWKKWQGEIKGLKMNKALDKKQAEELAFAAWAKTDTGSYTTSLLPELEKAAKSADDAIARDQHIREDVLGIELIQQGVALEKFVACFRAGFSDAALSDTLKKLATGLAWFYKNYDAETDKDVFEALMPIYLAKCGDDVPDYYKKAYAASGEHIKKWANAVYDSSLVASLSRLTEFSAHARNSDSTRLINDPAWQLYSSVAALRKQNITPAIEGYRQKKRYLNRLYENALLRKDKEHKMYPDANLTLRLAYGHVQGLDPDGKPKYSWQTWLKDVVELDDPKSESFKVPAKLKTLYEQKDFGRWKAGDDVPVAFLADNHTAGGNSGSPVLNKKGELIGLNFDRPYEGTMSDYLFDPNRCRNISVDIRYVLFVVEKFGGASWLIDEMKLVN